MATEDRSGRNDGAALGLPDDVGVTARLVRLDQLVRRALERLAGSVGISAADALVLAAVRAAPGQRAAPSQICETLDRTSGGMSLALDRLSSRGLLRRSADPADRRRVIVELTPEGLAVATRVRADVHAWETGLALSPAQRSSIERALTLLTDRMDDASR